MKFSKRTGSIFPAAYLHLRSSGGTLSLWLGRYSEPLGGLWETLGDVRSICGCGETLGGLFGPRKNLGWAILAAEKLGWALFWLRKNNAHAYILEI